MKRIATVGLSTLLLAVPASLAVAAGAEVAAPECLPNEANAPLSAEVEGVAGGDSVRLYFRRLHPSGAFYYTELDASGGGQYWTVFPKPEEREQRQLTDEWWELLSERDWIDGRSREEIEDWLEELEHEAAEYFVAIYDAGGQRKWRSRDFVIEVRDRDECGPLLTPHHRGLSENLTVGETTEAQVERPVFHWLCDGIVTRIGENGVLRGDEVCRACVVATWFPTAATAGAVVAGTTIHHREPRRASDEQP